MKLNLIFPTHKKESVFLISSERGTALSWMTTTKLKLKPSQVSIKPYLHRGLCKIYHKTMNWSMALSLSKEEIAFNNRKDDLVLALLNRSNSLRISKNKLLMIIPFEIKRDLREEFQKQLKIWN